MPSQRTLSPPVLIFANMVLDYPEEQDVGQGVRLAGSGHVFRDFAFFQETLHNVDSDGRLAVAYCPRLSEKDANERLQEFALLLQLHATVRGFNPAGLSTLMIQWPDNGNELWYVNSLPTPRREVSAFIAGKMRSTKKQLVFNLYWKEGWAPQEDAYAPEFPLILRYLWPVLGPSAWRGLRLLREGLSALTRGEHDIGLALVVTSFEALIPTHGTNNITRQLAGQIGFFTGNNRLETWFQKLYDLRSRTLHGEDPKSEKENRLLLLSAFRQAEKVKYVFVYCAYQIGLLTIKDTPLDSAMNASEVRKILHQGMEASQKQDNSQLCANIKAGTLESGFFFDAYDGSAPLHTLLRRGQKLIRILADWLPDSDKHDDRAKSAGVPPWPRTLDPKVENNRDGMLLDQLRQEFKALQTRIRVEQLRLLGYALSDESDTDRLDRVCFLSSLVDSWVETVSYQLALRAVAVDHEGAGS